MNNENGILTLNPLSKDPSAYCDFDTSVLDQKIPYSTPFLNFLEISKVYPLSPAKYSPKDNLNFMLVLGSMI